MKLFATFSVKVQPYHVAAAGVWGIILALILGIIEYSGAGGSFKLADHWFLATVGLSAIMYVVLSFLKTAVIEYRNVKLEGDESGD